MSWAKLAPRLFARDNTGCAATVNGTASRSPPHPPPHPPPPPPPPPPPLAATNCRLFNRRIHPTAQTLPLNHTGRCCPSICIPFSPRGPDRCSATSMQPAPAATLDDAATAYHTPRNVSNRNGSAAHARCHHEPEVLIESPQSGSIAPSPAVSVRSVGGGRVRPPRHCVDVFAVMARCADGASHGTRGKGQHGARSGSVGARGRRLGATTTPTTTSRPGARNGSSPPVTGGSSAYRFLGKDAIMRTTAVCEGEGEEVQQTAVIANAAPTASYSRQTCLPYAVPCPTDHSRDSDQLRGLWRVPVLSCL